LRNRRDLPAPVVQIKQSLISARREGVAFEQAWRAALHRCLFDQDAGAREASRTALIETRWAWKIGYEREGVIPGAVGLLALADALRDADDDHRGVVRVALRPGEMSAENRAEIVRARRARAQAAAKAKAQAARAA